MSAITIDSYRIVNILKERGFSQQQAEGLAEAIRSISLENVSTKSDVQAIVEAAKVDIMKWMFGGFLTILLAIMGIFVKLG